MQSDKISGFLSTVIFHGLLLCALLYWGYERPVIPQGEEGVLVSFGNTLNGGLGLEEPMPGMPIPAQAQNQPQSQAQQQVSHDEEHYVTQDFEDAPAVKPRKKDKVKQDKKTNVPIEQPKVTQQQIQQPDVPTEKPREVNRSALFPGKGTAATQGQGDGSGSGNQGMLHGTADGSIYGTGLGTQGTGYDLAGRSLKSTLPQPDYRVQNDGKVVVRIKVDRDGNVVEAKADQKGSTVIDATLYEAAERAARAAKFNPSPNSPIHQNGVITYIFKLGQ